MMVHHLPCWESWEERIEMRERQTDRERARELEQALTHNQMLARKCVGRTRGTCWALEGRLGV